MMLKVRSNEKGQALLLVLLAMAAILTVVLSVASRSVTDVSITSSEENALRAFSAAEAGVEKALLSGSGALTPVPVDTSDPNVTYTSTITTPTQGLDFIYPALLKPGETATFWFVTRDASGNFVCPSPGGCMTKSKIKSLCWGVDPPYSTNSQKPAVELSVYYDWNPAGSGDVGKVVSNQDFTYVKVARTGFDPYSARSPNNNFNAVSGGAGCSINGTAFSFHADDINFNTTDLGMPSNCSNKPGCLLMAKVRVFYNNTLKPEQVAIDFAGGPGNPLPAQGNKIESVGVAGESTRKVNVFQSFDEPPSVFDSAVFSYNGFSK